MKTHVRSLAAVAALLALVLALPVAGQGIVITSPSGGTQTSVVGTTSSCSVGAPDSANSVCLGSNAITAEGATADANETVLAFGDASADNTLTLKGTASGVEATVTTGALLTGAGTGTGRVSVGGLLCKGAPAKATTGTSEEVLATCTIPAATLTASGSTIRLSFLAHTAANGNNKRLRVRVGGIGGVVVLDTGAAALNNKNVSSYGPVVITRSGATTFTSYSAVVDGGDATLATGTITPYIYIVRAGSATWANTIDLVITGLTATAAGDVTLDSYVGEVLQ